VFGVGAAALAGAEVGAGAASRPGIVSTWPTEMRLGLLMLLAFASSSTVRPNLLAMLNIVSPGWIAYVAGSGVAVAACCATTGDDPDDVGAATATVVVRSSGATVKVGRSAFVAVAERVAASGDVFTQAASPVETSITATSKGHNRRCWRWIRLAASRRSIPSRSVLR